MPTNNRLPRRVRTTAAAAAALAAAALGQHPAAGREPTGGAIEARVIVEDASPWHIHPPGAPFAVDVRVAGAGLAEVEVAARWVDATRTRLGRAFAVSTVPRRIESPSGDPGFYGLQVSSPDSRVAFVPQPAGFPGSVIGFAIVAPPPDGGAEVDEASPFGLVHGRPDDPYLLLGSGPRRIGVHLKTMSWQQSAGSWRRRLEVRRAAGHVELPLIHRAPWAGDDTRPIDATRLDAIGERFARLVRTAPDLVSFWQAGREENGGDAPYDRPYYFANLAAKMHRLREEADRVRPGIEFVYSTRGHDLREFERLFASEPFREHFAALAQDPYRWPDFPDPETWLIDHIRALRARMDAAGLADRPLWFGELGLPVRGPNDPGAFFGYPDAGRAVPGADLDYAAAYLVKCHALALREGVERIYVYNYQNRGNDLDYAEHHFGLRSWASRRGDPGHPLPAYVAYVNMLAHLKGCSLVETPRPAEGVYVFGFAVNGGSARRILAWTFPPRVKTVPLAAVAAGLEARAVTSIVDLYGSPVDAIEGERLELGGRPIYLRF